MKRLFTSLLMCGVVAGCPMLAFSAETAADSGSNAAPASAQAVAPTQPKLSWGLDEIVKMSRANVGDSVILAYVNSSQTAYRLTAQDVIDLRAAGVSPDITTALIQRGEEVRRASAETYRQNQTAAASAQATAVQSAATYSTPTYTPAPAVSTVTVIGRPTFFNYPVTYYTPRLYYPRYYSCYPSVSFGFRLGGFHGRFARCW